jgi:hypothetical protein
VIESTISYDQLEDLLVVTSARKWAFKALTFRHDAGHLRCALSTTLSPGGSRVSVLLWWDPKKANQNTQRPGEWRIEKMTDIA